MKDEVVLAVAVGPAVQIYGDHVANEVVQRSLEEKTNLACTLPLETYGIELLLTLRLIVVVESVCGQR